MPCRIDNKSTRQRQAVGISISDDASVKTSIQCDSPARQSRIRTERSPGARMLFLSLKTVERPAQAAAGCFKPEQPESWLLPGCYSITASGLQAFGIVP